MLVEAYKAALKRWMTSVAIVATLFLMVSFWYSVYNERIEVVFIGWYVFVFLFVGTFALVSIYHVVLAYLGSKERPV
jgi:hypothetical protein